MSNIHDGHRKRMRERIIHSGVDGLSDYEMLEFLLYHTVPQGDVNPLAHRLIDVEFGSLAGVLEAEYDALRKAGLGERTALFLSTYLSTYKRYQRSAQLQKKRRFKTLDDMVAVLQGQLAGCREEALYALFLDNNLSLIRCEKLAEGAMRSVRLNTRHLAELCLNVKAAYVVMGHNHPSGILFPSDSDVRTTEAVREMLAKLDVYLLDHLILGEDDYVSMAQSKEYSYIFYQGRPNR